MSDEHEGGHHSSPEPYAALRTRALESLLIEKGLIASDVIDEIVRTFEQDIGPLNGAKVVARAWVDPEYRRRLLEHGTEAIADMGYEGAQGADIVVLENTSTVHNVVVCTLCSCYPWPVLGLPPAWYKSKNYRSRVVVEPRQDLREFGTEIPDDMTVRVHDSLADLRYMVLPRRPAGTEDWSAEQRAEIVTRDCMVGVVNPKVPENA